MARPRRVRVLISAGPTREHIDPVRYLTNESSGKMGFALAEAAVRAGCEVVLVAGPVALPTPRGVRRIDVVSARDMLAAMKREWGRSDVVFMAAAVADWRPARRLAGKWRAKDGGARHAKIELVRNPDVLATLTGGRRTPGKTVVAFALETGDGVRRARAKLRRKGADWIALNEPAVVGSDVARVHVLGAEAVREQSIRGSKRAVAERLTQLGIAARAR